MVAGPLKPNLRGGLRSICHSDGLADLANRDERARHILSFKFMSRSTAAARSVGGGDIETFLFHLAAEGVISTAQLQRAQEALRSWTTARAGAAEGEAQQPLQRPPEAAQGKLHAGGMEEDKEQREQDQLPPPQVHAKRGRLNSSQLIQGGECILPAALPREVDGEGPLSLLPDTLLDHLMSLLAAEPGASSIRRTCSWLRSAFDRCNTRLVLRQLDDSPLLLPPPQTLQLLLSSPCIRSLTMEEDAAALQWTFLSDAGRSMHRLEKISLTHVHLNVWDVSFLSHCTKLQHLDLRYCSLDNLRALASCAELQHLDLRGCQNLDLAPLASCVRLQRLNLGGCGLVGDLRPLASCIRLQQLHIWSCQNVQDLGPLASCVELQHLDLSGCKLLEDIGPLASCVKLQHLDLSYTSVSDLAPLAACVQLQHLDLSRCDELQDLGPLSACAALQHLCLRDCYQVADLAPLATCTGLLSLHAPGACGVEDIRALAACTGLQSLAIWNSEPLDDLSTLAAFSRLQYLDLNACFSVADLGPLAACVELRQLLLNECYDVQHLGPLAACVKLRYLDLSTCYLVEDLGPLASCVDLQVLGIWGCSEFEDLRPLSGCVKLQYLDLRGCEKAKDLRPLARCVELRVLEVSTACMAAGDLAPLAALSCMDILWA